MAQLTVLICDLCTSKKPKNATERLVIRSLSSSQEYSLDVCKAHGDQLQASASVDGVSVPALARAARKITSEKKSNGGAKYGTYTCSDCQRVFNSKQGLNLHELRAHKGMMPNYHRAAQNAQKAKNGQAKNGQAANGKKNATTKNKVSVAS